MQTIVIVLLGLLSVCQFGQLETEATTIEVKDSHALINALKSVHPGDTIHLHDGQYSGHFEITKTGTSDHSIKLTGGRGAKISNEHGYCLQLLKVEHWVLSGFTLEHCKKGLILDGSSHNVIDNIELYHVNEEGVHFRTGSSNNILQNSHIHDTGLAAPGYGEGVYIGSAIKHWIDHKPDHSDKNKILNNKIGPNVAAESIDVKEGTCCGHISGNQFDGQGMKGENSADSWIDLKGDRYLIENNKGTHSIKDGIQIHNVHQATQYLKAEGLLSGCNNTVQHNQCVDIKGQCVMVSIHSETVLKAHDCPNHVTP